MAKRVRLPELGAEQAAVDHAYACFKESYAEAQTLSSVSVAASDKDASDIRRGWEAELGTYDLADAPLVFMRVDADKERWYVGRRRVYNEDKDLVVVAWWAPAAMAWRLADLDRDSEITLRRRLRCDDSRVIDYADETGRPAAWKRTADAPPRPRRGGAQPVTPAGPKSGPAVPTAPAEPGEQVKPAAATPPPVASAPDVDDSSPLPPVAASQEDPFLLDSLNRARDDAMRDIVDTVHQDQLRTVAWEHHGLLAVQGGPGTGKTAVGLMRVTQLVENKLVRAEDVLVIGPRPEFLRYVQRVLPGLGVHGVRVLEPNEVWSATTGAVEATEVRAVKASARMAEVLRRAVALAAEPDPDLLERIVPDEDFTIAVDGRITRIPRRDVRDLLSAPGRESGTYRQRRTRFAESLVDLILEEYSRIRPGQPQDQALRSAIRRNADVAHLVDGLWPPLHPGTLLSRLYQDTTLLAAAADGTLSAAEQAALLRNDASAFADWSLDDAVCLDELGRLLGAPAPARVGHLVVDEAQDLTPMQARSLARRCTSGSITVLGDLTQSTGPCTYTRWSQLAALLGNEGAVEEVELTRSYRLPPEVLAFTAPLAKAITPDLRVPDSVRPSDGCAVTVLRSTDDARIDDAISRTVWVLAESQEDQQSVALVVPDGWELAVDSRFRALLSLRGSDSRLRIIPASRTQGLEFDHCVVLEPAAIASGTRRGLGTLYVALTRCARTLTVVHADPLPRAMIATPKPQAPKPRSDRMAPSTSCSRFHLDGQRCAHPTENPDGWCRKPDCAGYRTPEPPAATRFRSLSVPLSASPADTEPYTAESAERIRITTAARSHFVDRHGGIPTQAEHELRWMAGAFLGKARTFRQRDGYWLLDLDGYRLILSPDATAVTGYHCVHRERSYAQYLHKVPTRSGAAGRASRRAMLTPPQGVGAELADQELIRRLDVSAVHLTADVMEAYERATPGSAEHEDKAFVRKVLDQLTMDVAEAGIVRRPRHYLLIGAAFTWGLSLDGRVALFLRTQLDSDLEMLAESHAEGDDASVTQAALTAPIGSTVRCRIKGAVTARRFDGEVVEPPLPGRAILQLRAGDPAPEPGSEIEAWVTRHLPGIVCLSISDHGRSPIPPEAARRYRAALSVLPELWANDVDDAEERLTQLKAVAQGCLHQAQEDWLSLWQAIGRPDKERLVDLVHLAKSMLEAHAAEELGTAVDAVLDAYEASPWYRDVEVAIDSLAAIEAADDEPSEDAAPMTGVPPASAAPAAPAIPGPGSRPATAVPVPAELVDRVTAAAQADRACAVHGATNMRLLTGLAAAGLSPGMSGAIDVECVLPSGRALFEVLGNGTHDYEALRLAGLRLLEVEHISGARADHLFVALPGAPVEVWAPAVLREVLGVEIIWLVEDDWHGEAVSIVFAD